MLSLVLAAALATPARSPADFAILQGRTLILTRAKNAVAIVVDTNYDGYADELFWFYAEVAPTLRAYSEKSSIVFSGDELVVTSADTGETHIFSVGRPRIAVRAGGEVSSSASYAGYGLNHKMGPFLNAIRIAATTTNGRLQAQGQVGTLDCATDPDTCILYPDDGGGGGTGGTTCDSGGPGATSCSVTRNDGNGCFVACASGYYACCIRNVLAPPSCTCRR